MSKFDNPPTDEPEILENSAHVSMEQVEKYSAPETVDPYLATLRQKELESKDTNESLVSEKKTEIDAILEKALNSAPKGDEPFKDERLPEEKQQKKVSGLKKAFMTLGFLITGALGAKAGTNEKPATDDSTKNKIETGIAGKESAKEISHQLQVDWNAYKDWLTAKGLAGDASLDHGGLGFKMIEEYRKEHPSTTVSKETIDDIQEEFRKYREYALEQVREGKLKLKEGVTEENFMRALSTVDGIPGQRTTSFKFPDAYIKHYYDGKLVKTENLGLAKRGDSKTTSITGKDIAANK